MRKNFYPDTQINTVYELTPEWLLSRGVKALICDLDDTLAQGKARLGIGIEVASELSKRLKLAVL